MPRFEAIIYGFRQEYVNTIVEVEAENEVEARELISQLDPAELEWGDSQGPPDYAFDEHNRPEVHEVSSHE